MSSLWLDHQQAPLLPGETVLQAIQRVHGKQHVPTLCDAPHLKPFGSCRLCTVEVASSASGPWRPVGACHTPASDGMHVRTQTDALHRLRRNIVELVLSDHPLTCPTCEANGRCELQDVAAHVGIREVRYAAGASHTQRRRDDSHTYLRADLAKCIHCFRCIRACDEVQGQFILTMADRGFASHVVAGTDQPWAQSGCVSCGACVQACPTAALSDIFESAKPRPATQVHTTCTYCGVGCNLLVAVDADDGAGHVHSISAPWQSAVNPGHLCVKGRYAFGFYNHPERLRSPLLRKDGVLVPVSWEEALDFLATRLLALRASHGPDAIAGISSSRCTNEENYLMQKLMRVGIGTNNIDGCARVCHAPTALGMQRTFGTGAATNRIDDLQLADCVLVIGSNTTHGHPVTGAKIRQATLRGAKLIVVDPRRTELAALADVHLQLRPGSNVALLNHLLLHTVRGGWVDEAFVAARTTGFAAFREQLLRLDPQALSAITGVPDALVAEAARLYGSTRNAMCFHGLGVTEHEQGTFAVMLIAQLAMVTGHLGRPGVGVNPLRGQNNVQGAADMGVQPHQGAGYLDVTVAQNLAHYAAHYGVPVPSGRGLKIPEMFDAALAGQLRALWIIGEDVARTDPDTQHVVAALQALDLLVVQELFLTETAKLATLVLPGASFLEKTGTFTNGERRVQQVNRAVAPLAGARADGEILVEMLNRLGYPQPPLDADALLAEIASVVPFFAGITRARLGERGLQWPVHADGTDTPILHTESFPIGRAPFFFVDWQPSHELAAHAAALPLVLTTVRDLTHYNCGTMTRRTPNARLKDADVLWLHPLDAAARGISDAAPVRVRSARGAITLPAHITDAVLPGTVCTTFHFSEQNVNLLTGPGMDTEAKCPEYKVVAVEVERIDGPAHAASS